MATTGQQVLQVVSGDGDFNEADVQRFVSAAHIDTAGVDYQTIAITGPQSSGKSTLMNALVSGIAGQYAPLFSFVRHRGSSGEMCGDRISLACPNVQTQVISLWHVCSLAPPSRKWMR